MSVRKPTLPVYIPRPVPWWYKFFLLSIVAGPFFALFAVARRLLKRRLGVIHFIFNAVSYVFIALGVTVGLHRYFTHKSFQARRAVKLALAAAGSLAVEGPIITWVANHHRHHQTSDTEEDMHTPWIYRLRRRVDEPETVMDLVLGLFWSHVGWIFGDKSANPERYAKYLLKDADIVWFSRTFPIWVGFSIAFPILFGIIAAWLRKESRKDGALQGLLWGLIRIGLVHHVTWSINSICHVWGEHPYFTGANDHSGNVKWLGRFSMGESYHNKHHSLPDSALHGESEQDDFSYAVIQWMARRGWVWDVKVPTQQEVAAKIRLQEQLEEKRRAASLSEQS